MAKQRIFTVGFSLPGDEFEDVGFSSDQTLLDADIVLFEPSFGSYYGSEDYSGRSLFNGHNSFLVKRQIDHWRSEIVAAVKAGKLVIIYLVKPKDCYRYTGEKQFSGTGRSRTTTNIVTEISSYEAVPNLRRVSAKSGSEIRLEKDGAVLASYWNEFSKFSSYEVEIEGDFSKTLLVSRTGNRIVGAAITSGGGALLFLPPLHYDEEAFSREAQEGEDEDELYWTDEALAFGKRLVPAILGLADAFKKSNQSTPPPEWTNSSEYRLTLEGELESSISKSSAEIAALQAQKTSLERKLEAAGSLRRLLFEQGKPLEDAILEAMELFGFDAQSFADGESEFDGIFVSPEGRCLGEAEGKDSKPINIDKFSQLERNLQEDFARDDVTEYAKGLLFGNAYRLRSIDERSDFFTVKCASAAKRVGAALVRTPDMFAPARYLKENSSDLDFAKKCREAIFSSKGTVVVFPSVPISDAIEVTEQKEVRAAAGGPEVDSSDT